MNGDLPAWPLLEDAEESPEGPACWSSDCIINATAARALGLAAKPLTMACTSSCRKLTVVTDVVGVTDIDTTLSPLKGWLLPSSISSFYAR